MSNVGKAALRKLLFLTVLRTVIVGAFSFIVIVLFSRFLANIEPIPKKCIEERLYELQDGYWRSTNFDCKPFIGESDG